MNVVRANISLPADLKRRMDAVGERVNWSRLAAQAFEEALERIDAGSYPLPTLADLACRVAALERALNGRDLR